jgi:hypothetical protein
VRRDNSYGFNGQEKCPEIAEGHTTALFWEYDSRLGRRWNLDPKPNPSVSQYATFENNPIWLSDVKGDSVRAAGGKPNSIDIQQNRKIEHTFQEINGSKSGEYKKVDIVKETITKSETYYDGNGHYLKTVTQITTVTIEIDVNGTCSNPLVSNEPTVTTYSYQSGKKPTYSYGDGKSSSIALSGTSMYFQNTVNHAAYDKKTLGMSKIQKIAIDNQKWNNTSWWLGAGEFLVGLAPYFFAAPEPTMATKVGGGALVAIGAYSTFASYEEDPYKINLSRFVPGVTFHSPSSNYISVPPSIK